jgi:hypothetical protein
MILEQTRLFEMDAEKHVYKTTNWKPSFRIWRYQI